MALKKRNKKAQVKPIDEKAYTESALDSKKTQEATRKYSIDLPEWLYKKLKRRSLNESVPVRKIVLDDLIAIYASN